MLLALPKHALKVAFMFSYDVTKIVEPLPLDVIYRLMRPDLRHTRKGHTRFARHGEYGYDWFNGSFTVAGDPDAKKRFRKSTKVWDVFRFFQCSFVAALENWDMGTAEDRARILGMKDKRGKVSFSEDPEKVRAYCRSECLLLARMMRKVHDACEAAGIELLRYDGAGAIASALLRKNGVGAMRGAKGPPYPIVGARRKLLARGSPQHVELDDAILSAFAGGRFEGSGIGLVRKDVHESDVSSAYPYAQVFHPCLKCGTWRRISARVGMTAEVEAARLALCHFRVLPLRSRKEHANMAWGPLPCRLESGSIAFGFDFTGWAWKPEFLAAMAGWPDHVELLGAWVYDTDCDHEPFGFLPQVYRDRVRWGKTGAGIVLKLGPNAVAGKTMQRAGKSAFRSMIWGGNTTATTRAQLLTALCSASDRWNVHAMATDGIYSSGEELTLAAPRDTGTAGLVGPATAKNPSGKAEALGGWERETISGGVFFVKPGFYFSLDKDAKKMRARGLGRKEAKEERDAIRASFDDWDRRDFAHGPMATSRRFYAAKSSIYGVAGCSFCATSWSGHLLNRCPTCRQIGDQQEYRQRLGEDGTPLYGQWRERTFQIAFTPLPKRDKCLDSSGDYTRLRVRTLGGVASLPYRGKTTPEGEEASEGKDFDEGQPDLVDERYE